VRCLHGYVHPPVGDSSNCAGAKLKPPTRGCTYIAHTLLTPKPKQHKAAAKRIWRIAYMTEAFNKRQNVPPAQNTHT
jgi:hypothetical protein